MNMTMAQYRAYVRRTSGAGRIKRHATRTKAEETVLRALEAASDGGREYRIAQQVRNLFPLPGGGDVISKGLQVQRHQNRENQTDR